VSRRKLILCAGLLGLIAAAALAAPWLGVRDPIAQPDGLVLRYLPPFSRVDAILQADGSLRYAHEVRPLADGSVEYRRGENWKSQPVEELSGHGAAAWHSRPLFPLGTDGLGRDMLSRLLYGARISLLVGFLAATMALVIGAGLGLVAGLAGGWLDILLMRTTDLFLAVPRLFLALLLVALYDPSILTTVLVLGATTWMAAARLVRAQILSARERDWCQAARAAGAAPIRLGLLHLLPAAAVPLIVEVSLRVGDTILLEASLSFLGLGVPVPAPSWGNLIADGRNNLIDAWWISTLPGILIATTVIALYLLGDAARSHWRAVRT